MGNVKIKKKCSNFSSIALFKNIFFCQREVSHWKCRASESLWKKSAAIYDPLFNNLFFCQREVRHWKCREVWKTSKMQSLRVMEGIRSNTDFMKLQWISHNFDQSFENYRITAMGQGAGAASVEYLVHSPMIRWRIFWYWFWFCEVWACSTVS